MTKKKKGFLILSIILAIISMIAIVVFEAGNEPVFNSDAEKIVLVETDVESHYEYDTSSHMYVYRVRIECEIKNISQDSLLVKMHYKVRTVDGDETREIDSKQSKVLEGDTTYNAWVEFSHPEKHYGVLEEVAASVNNGEITPLLPEKDVPLTTGAMVSAVFFIAAVVGIVLSSKGAKLPIGEIDEDDYKEFYGDGYDPDRDGDSEEIKALKNEIEKEKLESTLTEIRSKKTKVCEYCGTRNKGENTQCSNCGARIK